MPNRESSLFPESVKTPEQLKDQLLKTDERMAHLMRLLSNDPCLEEDCDPILSPCCKEEVKTVFNTLPLQVNCKNCNKTYILRDLIKEQ